MVASFAALRWILVICLLALGAGHTGVASAGAYTVKACHADVGWVNNAWTNEATMNAVDFAAFQACPPGAVDPYGSVAQGLGVSDRLDGSDVNADGRFAEWRLVAPPDVRLSAFSAHRDVGNRNHLASGAFTPYARTDDGDLAGEGCFVSSGFYCRQQGTASRSIDSEFLAWGIRCTQTAFCGPGADLHHVWVAVSAAVVTVTDDLAPTVASPSGTMVAGEWVRGSQPVAASALDSTGIRRLAVEVDGITVATRTAPGPGAGGCGTLNQGVAYSYPAPCAGARGVNGSQSLSVATDALADGTRALRVAATDTGSNVARSTSRTIRIDNEPPPAPSLSASEAWSSAETAAVRWLVPSEIDRAPIDAMELEQCDGDGCRTHALPGAGDGVAVGDERPAALGATTFRVRHRDAAGNWSAWSEGVTVRRDRQAPVVEMTAAPDEVVVGETVNPQASGTDDRSGVRVVELEWQADGGPWRPVEGGVRLDSPGVARVRARAVDFAGNESPWNESSDIRFVTRGAAPVAPPAGTPETAFGSPTFAVAVRRLRLHRDGRRVRASGTLVPRAATGALGIGVRFRRANRIVRRSAVIRGGGAFRAAIRVPGEGRLLRRVRLRYAGDALHAPRTWRARAAR